jgi:molybdate transport system ATP-binding protein
MRGAALDAHVSLERPAFRLDAQLVAEPGEVVALMGPSGAGKSTLLAAIAGLVRLHAGHVRLDGTDLAFPKHVPPRQRGVVLLGQDPRLFPHLTALDNIAFGLRARGVARHEARKAAGSWLQRVGLTAHGFHRPAQLSGGQQQRVALARALATTPRLLLLDEPLTSLDPETASDIRALLASQLRAVRATALIATHDAIDAASLAQRLVILEGGQVSQHGSVREVLTRPATRFAAAAAGTNRLPGVAHDGAWTPHAGAYDIVLRSDDAESRHAAATNGVALTAFVRPSSVLLARADTASGHPDAGEWTARISRLEHTPGGARVHLDEPELVAEVPPEAIAVWGLATGAVVRVRVPASEVRFAATPDAPTGVEG